MPFEILRQDVTCIRADAIVNTANPLPVIGSGCDAGIHAKAGPQLLAARKAIGEIAVGSAAVTEAFGLEARYVIHAVSPPWQGGESNEEALLRSTYDTALRLAAERKCESIAFPLLAAGNYAFPYHKAMSVAVSAITEFLAHHEMHVILAVFHPDAFSLSRRLFPEISSFVDERYVEEKLKRECGGFAARRQRVQWKDRRREEFHAPVAAMPAPLAEEVDHFDALDFDEFLAQLDDGFTPTLLKLIDASGHPDPYIYKRANVDRKLFSKIRNNPNYKPSKTTALAFAIALELDLAQTKDLIGRAGFALTRAGKLDIIVEYFISRGIYDIHTINLALFDHDQPTLGLY